MPSWPRLYRGSKLRGLAAVALFAVMAALFVGADFGDVAGFPADASITASIGYAMFNLDGGAVASEGMLAAFEIIDIVLVAAVVGAVMLASRDDEEDGEPIDPVDGGEN